MPVSGASRALGPWEYDHRPVDCKAILCRISGPGWRL